MWKSRKSPGDIFVEAGGRLYVENGLLGALADLSLCSCIMTFSFLRLSYTALV